MSDRCESCSQQDIILEIYNVVLNAQKISRASALLAPIESKPWKPHGLFDTPRLTGPSPWAVWRHHCAASQLIDASSASEEVKRVAHILLNSTQDTIRAVVCGWNTLILFYKRPLLVVVFNRAGDVLGLHDGETSAPYTKFSYNEGWVDYKTAAGNASVRVR